MEYRVEIKEILSKFVFIEATSDDEAIKLAHQKYEECDETDENWNLTTRDFAGGYLTIFDKHGNTIFEGC